MIAMRDYVKRYINGFLLLAVLTVMVIPVGQIAAFEYSIYDIQKTLETRISTIVKTFDPKASVFVKARHKRKQVKLPLTPYILNEKVIDQNGRVKLRYLKVTILSTMESIPPSLDNLIREITSDYGLRKRTKINLVKVSPVVNKEKVLAEKKAEQKAEQFLIQAKQEKIESLSTLSLFQKILIGAGAFVIILYLISLFLSSGSINAVRNSLEDQLGKLRGALENGVSGNNSNSIPVSKFPDIPTTQVEVSTSASSIWDNMEVEGMKALFFDCYWCENDKYASFIWRKIPIETKQSILNENRPIREYANYITELVGEDQSMVHDPAYLNPQPLNHIDNKDLAALVKKDPILLKLISNMRVSSLDLKSIERVALMDLAQKLDIDQESIPDFDNIAPSLPRALKFIKKFSFASIDDELEVLSLKTITLETMERFPSLGWILTLKADVAEKIFTEYSAKQLASCWIAPPAVLDRLVKFLPQTKRELLESYLEATTPSRDSDVYQQLVEKALSELRNTKQMMPDSPPELKKAA